MWENVRILFLSANPWTTSRILVDEEAREIFERLQEGPYRNRFEFHNHTATRSIDLQRLLLLHRPHIVHFSGHGSKRHKLILGGAPGRGKTIDQQGLAQVLALYNSHLRLVVLNACFTVAQARAVSEVIDYAVGTGKGIGDKAGVAFAGAFYRALGFGKSVNEAFMSAKAELGLTKMPRTQGIELFVRDGIDEKDPFPARNIHANILTLPLPNSTWRAQVRIEYHITLIKTIQKLDSNPKVRATPARRRDSLRRRHRARLDGAVLGDCDTSHHK
jgi:CHAT domain